MKIPGAPRKMTKAASRLDERIIFFMAVCEDTLTNTSVSIQIFVLLCFQYKEIRLRFN